MTLMRRDDRYGSKFRQYIFKCSIVLFSIQTVCFALYRPKWCETNNYDMNSPPLHLNLVIYSFRAEEPQPMIKTHKTKQNKTYKNYSTNVHIHKLTHKSKIQEPLINNRTHICTTSATNNEYILNQKRHQ